MTDPRYTKLARLLVNYSTKVKKGNRVLLDMIEVPDEFSVELIRAVRAAVESGAIHSERYSSYLALLEELQSAPKDWE